MQLGERVPNTTIYVQDEKSVPTARTAAFPFPAFSARRKNHGLLWSPHERMHVHRFDPHIVRVRISNEIVGFSGGYRRPIVPSAPDR